MKLSIKSQYALEALLEMCFQSRDGSKPASIKDIADARGIPERFLGQILSVLRKAGIMESVRGVQGGYLLARDPGTISVGDIVRALEGSLVPVKCVNSRLQDAGRCQLMDRCVTRGLWAKIAEGIDDTFDSITIGDLVRTCEAMAAEGSSI